MKLALLSLISGLVVMFSNVCHAGFMIEPYLGYQKGTVDSKIASVDSTSDITGVGFGLRAGYTFLLPWVALDVKQFSGKDNSSNSNDVTQTDVGLTAGLDLPIVRPYLGYVLSSSMKVGSQTFKGGAVKAGVGFSFFPFVKLNLDYTTYDFKDLDGVPGASSVSDVYSSYKYSAYMLSVSIPL